MYYAALNLKYVGVSYMNSLYPFFSHHAIGICLSANFLFPILRYGSLYTCSNLVFFFLLKFERHRHKEAVGSSTP